MASDLVDILLLIGVPVLVAIAGAALLVLVILVFFHFRTKGRIDSLELLFKKHRDLCLINYDPRKRVLYRSAVPFMPGMTEVKNKLLEIARTLEVAVNEEI